MKKSRQYMVLQCVFIAKNKCLVQQCRCGRNVSEVGLLGRYVFGTCSNDRQQKVACYCFSESAA